MAWISLMWRSSASVNVWPFMTGETKPLHIGHSMPFGFGMASMILRWLRRRA